MHWIEITLSRKELEMLVTYFSCHNQIRNIVKKYNNIIIIDLIIYVKNENERNIFQKLASLSNFAHCFKNYCGITIGKIN